MHARTSSEVANIVYYFTINRIMYVTGFIYTVLKAGHNKMGSAN